MMNLTIEALSNAAAIMLAEAIVRVLDSRLHKRIHLGEEILVKGSLSKALKLDQTLSLLNSSHTERRQRGLHQLAELWQTLSQSTKLRCFSLLNWYEPHDLPWDDPRSNRKPHIEDK